MMNVEKNLTISQIYGRINRARQNLLKDKYGAKHQLQLAMQEKFNYKQSRCLKKGISQDQRDKMLKNSIKMQVYRTKQSVRIGKPGAIAKHEAALHDRAALMHKNCKSITREQPDLRIRDQTQRKKINYIIKQARLGILRQKEGSQLQLGQGLQSRSKLNAEIAERKINNLVISNDKVIQGFT